MITKNNWMSSEKLSELRKQMIDTGLVEIVDFPKYFEIFKSVSVSVAIVLIQKDYSNKITKYTQIIDNKIHSQYKADLHDLGIIPKDSCELGIINKVKANMKESFSSIVVGKMPFGINTNGKLGASSYQDMIDESILKDDKYNIEIMYSGYSCYTYLEAFSKNRKLVKHYKVCCGQQIGNDDKVLYVIKLVGPDVITSNSFPVLFTSEYEEEAVQAYKYAKSKLFRALVRLRCDKLCGVTTQRFSLVPLQDFTSDSDIDWSKSVDEIDKQLYKKYNLTQEEIDYIEKTIKPMK